MNRCLEQVIEILEQFERDKMVHSVFVGDRKQSIEALRADLTHVLTGMLRQKELEACVDSARKQIQSERKD